MMLKDMMQLQNYKSYFSLTVHLIPFIFFFIEIIKGAVSSPIYKCHGQIHGQSKAFPGNFTIEFYGFKIYGWGQKFTSIFLHVN